MKSAIPKWESPRGQGYPEDAKLPVLWLGIDGILKWPCKTLNYKPALRDRLFYFVVQVETLGRIYADAG